LTSTIQNRIKPVQILPFSVYYGTAILIGVTGLIVSIYLSVSHYRVYTDIGYKSFCAISRAINCDTVSQSPHSIQFNLPVPVWGTIGYSFALLLLLIAGFNTAEKKRIWSLLFWVAAGFSCYSVMLASISSYIIRSYCIMCIVSYAVNFLLLYYSWIILKRFSCSGIVKGTREDLLFLWNGKAHFLLPAVAFFGISALVVGFYPTYWRFQPPPLRTEVAKGLTAEGHPWIGAQNPVLEITEFADYQCFQCKKMHFFLRQLINANPQKIRIVHRNFPMDHEFNPMVKAPFHIGSGKMALLAVYAAAKNKFWEVNDLLYSYVGNNKSLNIKALADQAGLDGTEMVHAITDQATRYRLQSDIVTGYKLGIAGTPAYLIDGDLYLGQIPADVIDAVMK
jgi:protein-disulfide isomerase/uncharacterized membrane protein